MIHLLTRSFLYRSMESQIQALTEIQINLPGDPRDGGFAIAQTGFPVGAHDEWSEGYPRGDARCVGAFLAAAMILLAAESAGVHRLTLLDRTTLEDSFLRGLKFMISTQRSSGRLDLLDANLDSAPDTAFVLQLLAIAQKTVNRLTPGAEYPTDVQQQLETFIRTATEGVITGGFHTPNHRWVISSSLAITHQVWPEIADPTACIQSYRKEGLDIDTEGVWSERSAAIYDAVSNCAMLLLYETMGDQEALEAARKNLHFNQHLVNADGTIETGMSTRQDLGKPMIPSQLGAAYLWANGIGGEDVFLAAGRTISGAVELSLNTAVWLAFVLNAYPEVETREVAPLPDVCFTRNGNQIQRVRQGRWNLSCLGKAPVLMTAKYGRAYMPSLKIYSCYQGVGAFHADEFITDESSVRMISSGDPGIWHRPGYELPLGKSVDVFNIEEWSASMKDRAYVPQEALKAELVIRHESEGASSKIQYRSLGGLDGAVGQIALDFVPGGLWENESGLVTTAPGQVIYHKSGVARMWYGGDYLEIDGGHCEHTTYHMRGTSPYMEGTRVLLTFRTPADFSFTLRGGRGPRLI